MANTAWPTLPARTCDSRVLDGAVRKKSLALHSDEPAAHVVRDVRQHPRHQRESNVAVDQLDMRDRWVLVAADFEAAVGARAGPEQHVRRFVAIPRKILEATHDDRPRGAARHRVEVCSRYGDLH